MVTLGRGTLLEWRTGREKNSVDLLTEKDSATDKGIRTNSAGRSYPSSVIKQSFLSLNQPVYDTLHVFVVEDNILMNTVGNSREIIRGRHYLYIIRTFGGNAF